MKDFLLVYLIAVAAVCVIAFITYYIDKIKAQKKAWRVKESVLLGLGVIGGALGALLAMNLIRHKTKHWYFWAVNIVALLAHIAVPFIVYLTIYA